MFKIKNISVPWSKKKKIEIACHKCKGCVIRLTCKENRSTHKSRTLKHK